MNMTLVPEIHRMSVGIEQAILTVPIMDNKKKNKSTTNIIPTSTENGDVTVNGKTLLKKTYT